MLWVVGCGLWVVGCGLWVVGCGLCCGLASALSYDTHFVDTQTNIPPHIICQSNETPAKVSTADASSYTGEASAGLSRGGVGGGRIICIFSTLVSVR
jgi:hypothetical protein